MCVCLVSKVKLKLLGVALLENLFGKIFTKYNAKRACTNASSCVENYCGKLE